jgi:hypothetical protein
MLKSSLNFSKLILRLTSNHLTNIFVRVYSMQGQAGSSGGDPPEPPSPSNIPANTTSRRPRRRAQPLTNAEPSGSGTALPPPPPTAAHSNLSDAYNFAASHNAAEPVALTSIVTSAPPAKPRKLNRMYVSIPRIYARLEEPAKRVSRKCYVKFSATDMIISLRKRARSLKVM